MEPLENGATYDDINKTWSTTFPNYTISGISTCNETSGTWGTVYSGNPNDIKQETSGGNCWCRMTSPARSAWVFYATFPLETDCYGRCAYYCGSSIVEALTFRYNMFGSVGN